MYNFFSKIGILFIFSYTSVLGFPSKQDTVFNQTDNNGVKQGYWKTYYPDEGGVKYTGYFKDGYPVGEFKRYYESGRMEAIMVFDETGKKADTQLYYENGKLAAEGLYVNKEKHGFWKYYSFYNDFLSHEEHYDMGKKHGLSIKYYSNGKISEKLNWVQGEMEGIWEQYFDNGNLKLKATHENGKRTDDFIMYFNDGNIEIEGRYKDNLKEGTWTWYTEKGEIETTIEYLSGIPKNKDELDDHQTKLVEDLENNKGKYTQLEKTLKPTDTK